MSCVVIVQNSIKTVGLFRICYIKKLLFEGSKVIVIAPNDCDVTKQLLESIGVHVNTVSTGLRLLDRFKTIFHLNYHVFKCRKLDPVFVVHFLITFVFCFPALIFSTSKGVVFIEGLGSLFSKNRISQKILKKMLFYSGFKKVFMNSDERMILGSSSDVVISGIGVDIEYFKPDDMAFTVTPRRMVFVGRLIRDKGIYDAIEVLRNLLADGLKVSLDVVGDIYNGNPTSLSLLDIENIKNEFEDKISFHGFVNDVRPFYHNSSLLLLPSIREGFPVCVMEANASGILTVAYNVSGCKHAISQGVNGFLAEEGNINQLSKYCRKLLLTSDGYIYRRKAIQYAEMNFCRVKQSDEIVDIIKNVYSQPESTGGTFSLQQNRSSKNDARV